METGAREGLVRCITTDVLLTIAGDDPKAVGDESLVVRGVEECGELNASPPCMSLYIQNLSPFVLLMHVRCRFYPRRRHVKITSTLRDSIMIYNI